MNAEVIRGSCLCGTVTYETRAPTLFCAHCHCQFCRRAHGAAVVTWFGVAEDTFRLISGETHLTWYDSSEQSRRAFCAKCGTTLLFASKLCPGEMHIALATATTPIDQEPQVHVFVDQKVSWIHCSDTLPRLTQESEALSKYRDVSVTSSFTEVTKEE
ncbi:MAG: GFA family protein [bacterium]|nr:GFA family protein [bacterium]